MTTNTDRVQSRYAALHAERRDLLAAHRLLLDCGITNQTNEVIERLAELDVELVDLAAARPAADRPAAQRAVTIREVMP